MKNIEWSRVNIDVFYKSLHIFSRSKRNAISTRSELYPKKKKRKRERKKEKKEVMQTFTLLFHVKVAIHDFDCSFKKIN